MPKFEDFTPIFEIGTCEDNPAVLVTGDSVVTPCMLAGFVTALLEVVMRSLPDKEQIGYEERFNDALAVILKERFNYDIHIERPGYED
jgi:hypothetical protein